MSAQVGFRHHKDYQAYIWAKGEPATQVRAERYLVWAPLQLCARFFHFCVWQVAFSEEDLPRDDCEYILGYYSHSLNSIVGLSAPVLVRNGIKWTCSYSFVHCAAVCVPQATFLNILSNRLKNFVLQEYRTAYITVPPLIWTRYTVQKNEYLIPVFPAWESNLWRIKQ